jgi:hypothetical protein
VRLLLEHLRILKQVENTVSDGLRIYTWKPADRVGHIIEDCQGSDGYRFAGSKPYTDRTTS